MRVWGWSPTSCRLNAPARASCMCVRTQRTVILHSTADAGRRPPTHDSSQHANAHAEGRAASLPQCTQSHAHVDTKPAPSQHARRGVNLERVPPQTPHAALARGAQR
eukprot:362559-Chlamydomonas_euryale.AAC.2